ncbi:VOC family protein [Sphingobium sp.]|uniref:VOC family protein n=1 Tax=Sphingobium sp. TaxID=1912891 RepID=UPI0028BDFEE9|nr:VOC family protein [Sphingobium sp.]
MNIIGPDELIFGVEDIDVCATFLTDYGLTDVGNGQFEAMDGTCITLKAIDDPLLPPALPSGSTLRRTVWGVADAATLDGIEIELGRDRQVVRAADGSLSTVDDLGFAIGFQLTRRRAFQADAEYVNSPGHADGRPMNEIGSNEQADARPVTLSHVVYFVPDAERMTRFYIERLKFIETDRFLKMGPFLRPRGSADHHALFMIETPEHMKGLEHFAFHVQGPTALMLAGSRFRQKGYESFWGPGRHNFGSNWFWYFKSPLGAAIEYDADMDRLDEAWEPRISPPHPDNSQIFLLRNIDKWAPGGGPPPSRD